MYRGRAVLFALAVVLPSATLSTPGDSREAAKGTMSLSFPKTIEMGRPLNFSYTVVGVPSRRGPFPVEAPQVLLPLKLKDGSGDVAATIDQVSDKLKTLNAKNGEYAVSAKMKWPKIARGVKNLTLDIDVWRGSLSLNGDRFTVAVTSSGDKGYPGDRSLEAAAGPDTIVTPKSTARKSGAAAAAYPFFFPLARSATAACALPAIAAAAASFF